MIAYGFSIWHLTLSISFESEESANFSPIFLIDFAPVFIYFCLTKEARWLPAGIREPFGT